MKQNNMHQINVSIAYALPEQQWLREMRVPRGTSAMDLVEMSGVLDAFPDIVKGDMQLGVYSQKVQHDHLLEEGDQVEIYRPLTADPKEVRRQLALLGKTMGKGN